MGYVNMLTNRSRMVLIAQSSARAGELVVQDYPISKNRVLLNGEVVHVLEDVAFDGGVSKGIESELGGLQKQRPHRSWTLLVKVWTALSAHLASCPPLWQAMDTASAGRP